MFHRERFARAALARREPFAGLCVRYGLSRSAGYKWLARFLREGPAGLAWRSRRPARSPRKLAGLWRRRLVRLRRRHPAWGPRKLRTLFRRAYPQVRLPSERTLARWLRRLGLPVRPARRQRRGPAWPRPPARPARRSNDVWTVDFKGWFRTGDGTRVEPLTIRDLFRRRLLAFRLLPHQSDGPVRRVFRRVFSRHGLPYAIRCDNGAPFGGCGPRGLSRLSVWWRRLGIRVEFGRPAHPEDNAGHEQMHGVYQREVADDPARTPAAHQRRTDRWMESFNRLRPHQALGQATPAQRYRSGRRRLPARLPAWPAPRGSRRLRVNPKGYVRWQGRSRFVGRAFAGEDIALRTDGPGWWSVFLGTDLLGTLHAADRHDSLRPVQLLRANPPIVSAMSWPALSTMYCHTAGRLPHVGAAGRFQTTRRPIVRRVGNRPYFLSSSSSSASAMTAHSG